MVALLLGDKGGQFFAKVSGKGGGCHKDKED